MNRHVLTAAACFLAFQLRAEPTNYDSLKTDAEKFFAEGSFAKAHELYRQAASLTNLPAADARWAAFRAADTQWRSQAATQTADTTQLDDARRQLEVLIRDTREEDRDSIWAEVQESLGDFFWSPRNQNWGEAWPHFQQALDWWASAPDIEAARARYLKIVWRTVRPPGSAGDYWNGYNSVPLDILENLLKIAASENDRARAHYLIAMHLRYQGGTEAQRARVPAEFAAALAIGRSSDWYDDALYQYAEWMNSQGRFVPLANGGRREEPDYVKALELFRRLVSEFKKGETRYWEPAQQQIRNITEPQLGVGVPNIFLPDSEIQYSLNWRNVKKIELALYAVDLNRDPRLASQNTAGNWLGTIDLPGREKIKSWSHDTGDQGLYLPGNETLRLDMKLKPGAYVLEAAAGGKASRELILVTDAALVLKISGRQALAYCCNALNSAPLANARVKLWEGWWDDHHQWHARSEEKTAGADGLAVFEFEHAHDASAEIFVSAVSGERQAFSTGNNYWRRPEGEPWRIHAFTDRPAYRPGETVNWKFIARRYNGSVYSTPDRETVEFEIADPRGTKVKAGTASLNAFGSAWGSLDLTAELPLGEYRITFWNEGRKNSIGSASLFRLEEYKLPEFKVAVQTPEEETPEHTRQRKAFRPGEKVEATIQADYYFGGPVVNASVEVLVYQNPFYHYWHPARDYPWLYEDIDGARWNRWYGQGQVIKREMLKTDASGKATIAFDTPENGGQDFEYRIEARVTDSSRREITGNGTVRVTQQRYYVQAQPEHCLYRPQDKVRVNFKAADGNDQPVSVEGTVKITREFWYEIWLAPDGREVKGAELKQLQSKTAIWPPPPSRPDQRDWRLKFRGYEHDAILTRALKTGTNGEAELTFTPEREGYYQVDWASEDPPSLLHPASRISADATVWVANNATTDLGYRGGEVEIIADQDTFRVGQKAPVMLVAPAGGRYVLFTIEGDDLYSYQLVHLDGTAKLLELPIEEKHVPNIFLSAVLVNDREIFTDTKQIVVPPAKNFLTIDVKPDREQYQPQQDGTFTITTRNDEGKPAPAEVAFSLVDESVFYIQNDYAGDPRQFFFGAKRGQQVQTGSTLNQKRYLKLVEGANEQLIDERAKDRAELQKVNRWDDADALSEDRSGTLQTAFGGATKRLPSGSAGNYLAKSETIATAAPAFARANIPAPAMAKEIAGEPAGPEPAVVVRSDFRSTILWQPDVVTDREGRATVKVKYPDSLTGWKATARAASAQNQFGIGDAATRTKQPLIVRLEAPRFFVVGDTVTISAVVNNNTDEAMDVKVALETGGLKVGPASSPALKVPAHGEARADWTAEVPAAGEVKLKVSGRAAKYSDAMEKTFTAHEHGIEKFLAKSGKARGDDFTVKFELPRERKPGSTSLTVQVTPSLAVTMLDALPYLIDYPYGCTEQTMSRFLPAAITAKTLRDLGLQPEDVMSRVFGGIETSNAAATHPKGKHDLAELGKIEKASLDRLYDFQHGDGGWGWWKAGESDRWMTAYVVWGLALARYAGVEVKRDVVSRGARFLDEHLVEEELNPGLQAFMLHALAASATPARASKFQERAFTNLWNNRDQLNAYTRALLALSAQAFGKTAEARTLIENLENGVKRDEHPDTSVVLPPGTRNPEPGTLGTAHWGEDGLYWRWSDGGVEATAFALRALLAIDPTNRLVEPVANWLIKNRRGAQWNSTRDTAIVVLALNDYLRASGELTADVEYEVVVNGTSVAKKKISGADVFNAPDRLAIDPRLVRENNEIRLRRSGGSAGALYFAVEAKFFSTEEPVAAAGNEIFVKREYFKLVGRPTLLKGYVYDRQPLRDGDRVKSGERVETVLTIEGKNNYEYLLFEDLKPAGLEAVEVRSGGDVYARELKHGAATNSAVRVPHSALDYTGRTRGVYQELRDRKVALFIDKLPEGIWEIHYDLRAEAPGKFHALPVVGQAMYVPEIRCNGAETRLEVVEGN